VADVRAALDALGPPHPSEVESGRSRGLFGVVPADAPAARPSAVLAPLYDHALPPELAPRAGAAASGLGEVGAHVLLTRRTWGLRTHQGEVSFPGGRVEPGEAPADAARREAFEEVGIDRASIEVIGELDRLATVSSGSFIVPYVGVLPGRPQTVPSPHEVEAVLHVPLAELLDPAVFREERWVFPDGGERPITFFELVGDTVWGATASLLRQLLGFVTGTLGRGDLGHP
jgi:8-oxo-dGTP pyrophosphatase MutT (NUDIX family)